jgi:hypothetical protein
MCALIGPTVIVLAAYVLRVVMPLGFEAGVHSFPVVARGRLLQVIREAQFRFHLITIHEQDFLLEVNPSVLFHSPYDVRPRAEITIGRVLRFVIPDVKLTVYQIGCLVDRMKHRSNDPTLYSSTTTHRPPKASKLGASS